MADERENRAATRAPVSIFNGGGKSPFLLVCEHASNYIPEQYNDLGLDEANLKAHIAWDPGAIEVGYHLSKLLDAELVECKLSRLLIDCNRPLDAPDLIPVISESTFVPGNENLSSKDRVERIDLSHRPFHNRIEQVIREREQRGQASWVVTLHSFTPVYRGVPRPWEIGILHDDDQRISTPLIAALRADKSLTVGDNEPYKPADRVYYTLERHARTRNAPCVMIEIRNNVIAEEAAQKAWAERLARIFEEIGKTLPQQLH